MFQRISEKPFKLVWLENKVQFRVLILWGFLIRNSTDTRKRYQTEFEGNVRGFMAYFGTF